MPGHGHRCPELRTAGAPRFVFTNFGRRAVRQSRPSENSDFHSKWFLNVTRLASISQIVSFGGFCWKNEVTAKQISGWPEASIQKTLFNRDDSAAIVQGAHQDERRRIEMNREEGATTKHRRHFPGLATHSKGRHRRFVGRAGSG